MYTLKEQKLCPIALGCAQIGSAIPQTESEQLLDNYVELGGNQVDTARVYAAWLPAGEGSSERALGAWLKRKGRSFRDQLFIGTKGGHKELGFNPYRGDNSRENLAKDLEASLTALDCDVIDLYWLHRDERSRAVEEIIELMNEFVRQGKVRFFGASNWTTERIKQANDYAASKGLQGFAASEIQYGYGVCTPDSWGDPTIVCMDEAEYEVYRTMDLPVYAYSAQSEGYFAMQLSGQVERIAASTMHKYDLAVNRARLGAVRAFLAGRTDIDMPLVSLEYVLSSPFPAVYIHGGRNLQRLTHLMKVWQQRNPLISEPEWRALQASCGLWR